MVMSSQVRRALRQRRMTQEELAARLGVTVSLVNRTLNQRDSVGPLPLWDEMAGILGGRWDVWLDLDDDDT